MQPKKEFDWFDRPESIKKLWVLLWGLCALTVVLQFFTTPHGHFGWDNWYAFPAALGFVSCAVLIVVAKGLGLLLKRKTTYYAGKEADRD